MSRALVAVGAALLAGGCAQLFGLDETSAPATPNDAPVDSRAIDAPADALACTGGDARVTDATTGACYVLFKTPATRNTARTMCQTLGARLASVQSAAENTLVANLAGASDAFLGGNDEAVENTFVWDDGTAVVLTSWNTATAEPNNGQGAFEEDCIVMLGAVPGKWDDKPCAPGPVGTGMYAYVCER